MSLKLDYSKTGVLIMKSRLESLCSAHNTLHDGSGLGNDFLGWMDLPVNYNKEEFDRVKAAGKKIQEKADVLIVIGIGGSYLGAKAAIEGLSNCFYNMQANEERKGPQVLFAGHTISGTYLSQMVKFIEGKDVCLNVISKSGTTTEPGIAFRVLKKIVEENTARMKRRRESSPRQIKQEELFASWLTLKVTRHSSFRMMSADVSPY